MSFQLQQGDVLFDALFHLFVLTLVVYYVFTAPRWKHLCSSLRARYATGTCLELLDVPQPGVIAPGAEPHVTIAICAYNEGAVVPQTIDHACRVQWPRDKLTIHVCDDSTDPESVRLIQASVAHWKAAGVDIERLSRPDRVGYKAGNLRYNFRRIKGDFVAYFDADHRAEPTFLQNCMPYFYDQFGKVKKKTGLVQTPWAFHNTHQNILTECDSFCLDTWYIYEYGRSLNHKLFGFWGTGGIWQKQAVADAGGFTWESVTEDMLLSYRAYMNKRYEFVYLPQYPQLLEVPPDILAHIQQKHRWTKGYLQVFRIYCWDMLSSPKVPFKIKYEFLVHVLGSLHFIFNAMSFILMMHLKMPIFVNSWLYKFNILFTYSETVLTPVAGLLSKTPASNGHYQTLWQRLARLRFWLPYTTLQLGMTPFETKAILDGLFSEDNTFLTTPKQGSPTKPQRHWSDNVAATVGLALAAHQVLFLYLNDPFAYIEATWLRRICQCSNWQFCIGLVSVAGSFFWAKYQQPRVDLTRRIILNVMAATNSFNHQYSPSWSSSSYVGVKEALGPLVLGLSMTAAVAASICMWP